MNMLGLINLYERNEGSQLVGITNTSLMSRRNDTF